ncbi:uncharacterized protein [Nicotiana tomentosiformis]|uniref:uncharacterized protein n=1 Tax=Nicotiana tomentosiformis TaxID=4098 RepID=UPI00388C6F51
MRFSELACHAVWMVTTDRERIRRFIDGLTYQLQLLMTRERVSSATFDEVVDIARQIEMVCSQEHGERKAKRPRRLGPFSAVPSGGPSSSYPGARGSLQSPPPTPRSCFVCGEFGNMWRQCPRRPRVPVQQKSQAATSAPVTSPPAQPASGGAQSARGLPRGGGRSSGSHARFYVIPAIPDVVSSDEVITVGDTIIVDRVYRSCVVTIERLDTRVDRLLLSMVDFDVILGMDWLSPCYTMLDCHAKTVTLVMPGLPRIEWRGSLDYIPSRVISYLKDQRMLGKRCLSYLAFVRDVGADTPTIDYVPVVRDFPDVFSPVLSGMLPDRDIDFGIDLLKPHEKNYLVHDLELVAIVHALKIWRHYLYGVSCEGLMKDLVEPQCGGYSGNIVWAYLWIGYDLQRFVARVEGIVKGYDLIFAMDGVEACGIYVSLWILYFSISEVKETSLDSRKVSSEWVSQMWHFWVLKREYSGL